MSICPGGGSQACHRVHRFTGRSCASWHTLGTLGGWTHSARLICEPMPESALVPGRPEHHPCVHPRRGGAGEAVSRPVRRRCRMMANRQTTRARSLGQRCTGWMAAGRLRNREVRLSTSEVQLDDRWDSFPPATRRNAELRHTQRRQTNAAPTVSFAPASPFLRDNDTHRHPNAPMHRAR